MITLESSRSAAVIPAVITTSLWSRDPVQVARTDLLGGADLRGWRCLQLLLKLHLPLLEVQHLLLQRPEFRFLGAPRGGHVVRRGGGRVSGRVDHVRIPASR